MGRKAKIQSFIWTLPDGEERNITVTGRDAWCLNSLIDAGKKGITPIDNPAPRIGAYVFNLRKLGLDIETKHESHGGPYAGVHGRYVIHSKVERVAEEISA